MCLSGYFECKAFNKQTRDKWLPLSLTGQTNLIPSDPSILTIYQCMECLLARLYTTPLNYTLPGTRYPTCTGTYVRFNQTRRDDRARRKRRGFQSSSIYGFQSSSIYGNVSRHSDNLMVTRG